MRIISGIYRGRQIRPPGNLKARPTTDFAKEGLFNILAHRSASGKMAEMEILDLFAGTGSITYEFASRGVRSVVAVEIKPLYAGFIRKTCMDLGFDHVDVIRADAFRYLNRPYQSFDLIFADPPYDHPRIAELPDLVISTEILSERGTFILEHPARFSFSFHSSFQQHRRYGGVHFSFFEKE